MHPQAVIFFRANCARYKLYEIIDRNPRKKKSTSRERGLPHTQNCAHLLASEASTLRATSLTHARTQSSMSRGHRYSTRRQSSPWASSHSRPYEDVESHLEGKRKRKARGHILNALTGRYPVVVCPRIIEHRTNSCGTAGKP